METSRTSSLCSSLLRLGIAMRTDVEYVEPTPRSDSEQHQRRRAVHPRSETKKETKKQLQIAFNGFSQ